MKNLLILIFCLWLVGCETPRERDDKQTKEYPELQLQKIYVGNGTYRLENSEVVCYDRYEHGLQCNFKGEK
jgi:hypothetical protein